MAILTEYGAYFDASGKPDDPTVLYVSGFISSEAKWLKFETEWRALLKDFGIAGPFHTTDYVAGEGDDYKSFKNDDARRDAFENRAVKIIKLATMKPISHGLVLDDFREIAGLYNLPKHLSRPYAFCAYYGFKVAHDWMIRKIGLHDPVQFIYEDGDDDRGLFSDAMHELFKLRPTFFPKNKATPFQAADILAWRHARLTKDMKKLEAGGKRPRREFFAGLFKQIPQEGCGYFDRSILLPHCEQMDFPRKTRYEKS